MNKKKRVIDVLVISDVHLGTYGCHAKELLHYLKSIKPKIVVLNGDIIDIWQFSKSYWPKYHMKVVKHLFNWIGKGVKTYYVTGNHDEMLRKFSGLKMGSFRIVNKIVLDLPDNKKAWIFHGDVFDITMQHSKWLARLGAVGYDTLILINRFFNFISEKVFKKGKISLSKKIKNSVKSAVKFINNFEQTSADIGISNGFDYVICGHIHQPEMRVVENNEGSILYLNSGDWIENLSALEFVNGEWSIYRFKESDNAEMLSGKQNEEEDNDLTNNELFDIMLQEFNLMRQ
ncbi:UDP-2,3-diacylglucosamine diphosphatase [Segetibacter koreensis]|uniref:UDP-2,3-diacylglucosamine diphosphatase n=1 Tax=Segetibacter koreensis TaxID=398037 RepID=UPI000371C438|nr:UDP-2,3-diacylglucosamine diphosphatase [Segetibacter koreensis]